MKVQIFLEKIKTIILVAILIVSIVFVGIFVIGNKKNENLNNDLMVIHDVPLNTDGISVGDVFLSQSPEPGEILASMAPLIERNSDTVGWVKIDDVIDNVVVQGNDNEYYLTKDFDGNFAEAGTIFLDQYCQINPSVACDNLVVYGHNQMNGSMFGMLTKYKRDPMFVEDNPYISFSNNYHNFKFKIFSFFVINTNPEHDDEAFFPYHMYTRFNDQYTYDDFIREVTRRSMITSDIDVNESDTFITLSTCAVDFDDARFVIVGRAVRDEDDLAQAPNYQLNPDTYFPKIYYDLNCDKFEY